MDKNWVILKENIFYRLFVCSCYINVDDNTYSLTGDEIRHFDFEKLYHNYDDMIAAYTDIIVHPDDREIVGLKCSREYLKAYLKNEEFFVFDFRRNMGNGYQWHRMHVVVDNYNIDGSVHSVLLSTMCIEDVKQREYEYQEKLEAANKAKSDFLLNVSHDLRTPMNAIMGFMTLLEKDADNPCKVREYVKKLKASGRHLLSIINDVLDMNKIESREMRINSVEFELSGFLETINTVVLQLTRDKTQNFFMELENVKNNRLVGDETRLNQILINILSNSIKYTGESGDIRLIVRQIPDDSKCHLQFKIVDNGIGMEAEFLTRIFEPFAREENRIPDDVTGTGLGMPITKNLVDLMGGEIHIDSNPGVGTVFCLDMWFEIPENLSADKKEIDKERETVNRILQGRKFLVAEDNEVNGEIISRLLEIEGASAVVCPNGQAAVDTFLNNPKNTFDMILMDVRMPVLDGYGATRLIRSSKREDSKIIPIISLTANAFSEDVDLAIQAGMNAHVPKPIDFEVLKSTIRKFMVDSPM